MKRIISLILCVLVLSASVIPLASCDQSGKPGETTAPEGTGAEATGADVTEPETEKPEEKGMELIPDLKFEKGLELLSQKDHANGDAIKTLGTHSFYADKTAENPVWRLAQWDSGPCLIENRVDRGISEITDGAYRSFSYLPSKNEMTFFLDTSLYYQGKPAKQGDYWPHLLIEEGDFGYQSLPAETKAYYSCGAEKLVFSMDVRMDEYDLTKITGDWVRAAQFLLYFYVKGVNSNDFCWFGVQIFDNRTEWSANYIGYDGGKPDASSAMIYLIGTKNVYPSADEGGCPFWFEGKPLASDDWMHVEIDLKPYLEDMLNVGKKNGYFKVDSLDDLCINGMNIGWETIGTFCHSMSVKDMSLRSYLASDLAE